MFTSPVLWLLLLSVPAADFNPAAAARDIGRLMRHWHEASPSLAADRRRMTRLMLDDATVTIDGERMTVRDPKGLVLEQYDLGVQDGKIWSMRPVASESPLAEARELLHRGAEHIDAGELDVAQTVFTRAAELADSVNHAATRIATRRGLGAVATTRGDVKTARAHNEQGLAIALEAGDRHNEGRAHLHLAHIARMAGDYAGADKHFAASLAIFRERNDRLSAAHALIGIGLMHNIRADWVQAQAPLEEALRTTEELGNPEGIAAALNALGIRARTRASYVEATALLRRAFEVYRSIGDVPGMAIAQGNLGVALAMTGQYAEAVTSFREALALHERLGRYHNTMYSLGNTGEMYRLLGDFERAREHFQRALAMAEKVGFKPGIALNLHNLAQVKLNEDDPRGAIALYEKSLALDETSGDRDNIARTLHNLGRAHRVAGNLAEARAATEKSLAIAREIKNRELIVQSLGILADMTTDGPRSIELAKETLAAAEEIAAPEIVWAARVALGRAYRRAGKFGEARVELEQAVAIVEELRRSVPGEEIDQQQAFATLVMPYQELVGVLVEQRDFAGALEFAERAKARVLVDVLRNGRPDLGSVLTAEERNREAELAAQLSDVNREYRAALESGRVGPDVLAKVRKARFDYEGFLDVVFAAHPQLRHERGEIRPARLSDAETLLANGAADALLEFVVTEEETYLFTITAAGLRVHTIPRGRIQLRDDVRRYRELLANHDLTYGAAARSLYDTLLGPAAAQLRGKKTLCIVPDGPLWELPFQTLQPSSTEFVLDRHALYLAPSLTVLSETMRTPMRRQYDVQLLAFGNPVVPTSGERVARLRGDVSLAPLPHTETEIRNIAALYGEDNSRVHLRSDAREEVVKEEAGRYDVLHFATHGVLDDQNALYSRLVFSPPASEREDGMLEAREIMRLDLRARLAVLSACETARGNIGAGEGLIGMSWALFVAGVPTSVVSQWSVESASTAGLMIEFHRNLRVAGRSTAEALRRAALATRAKPAYRHPFYWAPFVVVGNAR